MDSTSTMQELVNYLNETAKAYYVDDAPVITDRQWDALYDKLKKMEDETGVRLPDSPTRRVGGEPLAAFSQHKHITRLWSMDKAQNQGQLAAWMQRVEKQASRGSDKPIDYYIEYKFDGLTINLTYENGQLIQASTRGNGEVGEAILPQAMTVRAIPLSIPYQGLMEVQGECIMRLSVLEKYNETAAEPLKNARNGAAGALRNLDPAVTASRKLDAFFYQVATIGNPPYTDQEEMLAFLRENGFPVSPYLKKVESLAEMEVALADIMEARHSLDFMIDGAAIKVGDFSLRQTLGYTDKFPRWAIAYKFEAEEATTTLENVTWEPGRTGKITPLAHLEAVDFDGVTVKKATLNNWGDIQRKGVALGCQVWVRRSNDVIPEIMGRVGPPSPLETPIEKPTHCPACGTELIQRGALLFCMNRESCRPQAIARLAHFASRNAMDIETFSEKTAGLVYDTLHVRTPADLYRLTKEELLTLEGFKEKRATNLLDALEKSKHCTLDAFLYALGISNVGRKTARDLASAFGSLESLQTANTNTLIAIPEVGDIVAQSIVEFFSFPENKEMIAQLLAAGVHPQTAEIASQEGAFTGLSIVMTGTLPNLTRNEAEELIRKHGGTVSSSVSKKTGFVLLGENPGSKLQRAESLGIPVLNEEEFMKRIRGTSM